LSNNALPGSTTTGAVDVFRRPTTLEPKRISGGGSFSVTLT
jgi:hypothetical protein